MPQLHELVNLGYCLGLDARMAEKGNQKESLRL